MKARGYITKSKSGHYTAKAVAADGSLLAISDKLPDLEAARAFNRDALDPNNTPQRLHAHRMLHRIVGPAT